MKKYDYCIIGAGPTGLTLATLFSSIGKKCIIIDENDDIGGCHRVKRVNGLFTEHGPRVYSDSYINFINLLKLMNINFYELFKQYNFTISNIGNYTIKNFTLNEIKSIVLHYLIFIFKNTHGLNTSMKEFMDTNIFSEKTKDYIDRLCRLTDGASSEKYSLNKFFQLINQQFLHTLYQPNKPNDIGLFRLWKENLLQNNVEIILNSKVLNITGNIENVELIEFFDKNDNNKYFVSSENYIMCIPPKPLLNILSNNIYKNSFGDIDIFKDWVTKSTYNNYIPISFHWSDSLNLKLNKIWGFPSSEWGIAFIVLSNYINFNDKRSNIVISTCVTKTDTISSYINKTANQCNEDELKQEVFRQLKLSFPTISDPSYVIINPNLKKINNKWIEPDTAYIQTFNNTKLSSKGITRNLFQVGTQNGNSKYSFTSLESAVTNAIVFANYIEPVTLKIIKKTNITELNDIIRIFILFFIIIIYVKIVKK